MRPIKTTLRHAGGVLVLTLIAICAMALGASPAHAAGAHTHGYFLGLTGAAVNYEKVSDLSKGYRRATTKIYQQYTRTVDEYQMFDDIPDEEIMPSGRENNILLDVAVGTGAHQADDAGYESVTNTPELEEGSFVFNHTNARFSISLRAQAFDRKARAGQIIRQIKYQSLKCIEAVMRKYGYMSYGFSTGIVAQVSGNPASGATAVVTLKNAFGYTGLNNPAYLVGAFPIGERVGFIRAGVLIGLAEVTGNDPVAGTIDVTFDGDTVDLADSDSITYANGAIGATLSETDYNKWNVGRLEALTSDSVHGVATSDVSAWAPALLDTNGGSAGFLTIRRIRQALANKGDTTLRKVVLSNGVQNDKDARERAAVMWAGSGQMNLDGNASIKGVEEITTRFVPPTCLFGDGADAFGKKVLTDKVDPEETIEFAKLYKAEDRSALKGGVDLISAVIVRARSRTTGFIGLNEQ